MARLHVPSSAPATALTIAAEANVQPAPDLAFQVSKRAPNKTAMPATMATDDRKEAREARRCPWKEMRITGAGSVKLATAKKEQMDEKKHSSRLVIQRPNILTAPTPIAEEDIKKGPKDGKPQLSRLVIVRPNVSTATKAVAKKEVNQEQKDNKPQASRLISTWANISSAPKPSVKKGDQRTRMCKHVIAQPKSSTAPKVGMKKKNEKKETVKPIVPKPKILTAPKPAIKQERQMLRSTKPANTTSKISIMPGSVLKTSDEKTQMKAHVIAKQNKSTALKPLLGKADVKGQTSKTVIMKPKAETTLKSAVGDKLAIASKTRHGPKLDPAKKNVKISGDLAKTSATPKPPKPLISILNKGANPAPNKLLARFIGDPNESMSEGLGSPKPAAVEKPTSISGPATQNEDANSLPPERFLQRCPDNVRKSLVKSLCEYFEKEDETELEEPFHIAVVTEKQSESLSSHHNTVECDQEERDPSVMEDLVELMDQPKSTVESDESGVLEELTFIPAPHPQPPPQRSSRSSSSRRVSGISTLGDSFIAGGTPPPDRPPIICPSELTPKKRVRFHNTVTQHVIPGLAKDYRYPMPYPKSKAIGRSKMLINPSGQPDILTLNPGFVDRYKQIRRMAEAIQDEDPQAAGMAQQLYGTRNYKVSLALQGNTVSIEHIIEFDCDGKPLLGTNIADRVQENFWADVSIYKGREDRPHVTLEKPDFDVPVATREQTAMWRASGRSRSSRITFEDV